MRPPVITVIAEYLARPGKGDEVADVLALHVTATRNEPGCLQFSAHRSREEADRFVLYEQYVDEAALTAHRASTHFVSYVEGTIVPLLAERRWAHYAAIGPAQMRVRPARAGDVATLERIVADAYGVYIERIGRRPAPMDDDYGGKVREGHVYVADDGAVRGVLVVAPAPDHVLIENVAVDPDRQRRGTGRRLMAYAERFARDRGVDELRLYTNVAMSENLAFYDRLGYRESHRASEGGFQRVFLVKRLT